MITADSSELRETSALPPMTDILPSPILETVTGADILVSTLQMPATTELLIRRHVEGGALLIQRKSGRDLISSIGHRVNSSLAKMRATGAAQWQCILLSTGIFLPNYETGNTWVGSRKGVFPTRVGVDHIKKVNRSSSESFPHTRGGASGKPFIFWKEVKWNYKSLATELRRYTMRGGVYIPLTCDEEIPGWLRQAEKDLHELSSGSKELWPSAKDYPPDPPSPEDPLQELVPVTDGRTVLAMLKGVGPARANSLWQTMREYYVDWREGAEPDLANALFWASVEDPELYGIPKVKLWGEGTRTGVREQMGLEHGFDFRAFVNKLVMMEDESA